MKCSLFSYLKIQTVAQIARVIANAASFSCFIFHKGKKKSDVVAVYNVVATTIIVSYYTIKAPDRQMSN